MPTLANILAGQPGNPYQQPNQGIAPLLSQYLLNRSLSQNQLGQAPAPQPAPPVAPAGQLSPLMGAALGGQMGGQMAPMGLGAMPNPQTAALLQALQGGQVPGP